MILILEMMPFYFFVITQWAVNALIIENTLEKMMNFFHCLTDRICVYTPEMSDKEEPKSLKALCWGFQIITIFSQLGVSPNLCNKLKLGVVGPD